MTTNMKNILKNLIAAVLIIAAFAACPVTAQAAELDTQARAAVVASVETIMEAQYPEGTPMNNTYVYSTQIKINGTTLNYTGYGCAGFAMMFEDTCYGKGGSYNKIQNCAASSICVGDIVRVASTTGGHTFVVTALDESGATIAEANYNGAVHYGRHISTAELAANEYVMHRV